MALTKFRSFLPESERNGKRGPAMIHYGVHVTEPTTGVVSNNTPEWLGDAMFDHGAIDLAWEEHVAECDAEDHDHCGPQERGDILIGAWKKGADGLWEPDTSGEYAAIVRELVTQVVWSKYTKRCAMCSPCYPGQADLDNPRENGVLRYDLPPDMYGEK